MIEQLLGIDISNIQPHHSRVIQELINYNTDLQHKLQIYTEYEDIDGITKEEFILNEQDILYTILGTTSALLFVYNKLEQYELSADLHKEMKISFCLIMDGIRDQGLVFRYEDIQAMGDDGVNGNFAPEGQTSYDIFLWKGGVYCHHFWKRQIYFRKREKGKFLPNDGLKNDKRVGNVPFVKKKGFESVKPIDTPTRGSLKYS